MDTQAVKAAIAELAPMLQADGADLILIEANPSTARIEVRLEVSDATCAECVLPGPLLEQVISEAISRHDPAEFELILRDPRTAGASGH